MKTKKLNLLFASVFALVFLIGFASATITLTPSVTTLSQASGSFNLTVSSNQNEIIDLSIPSVSDGSGKSVIFTLSPAQVIIDIPSTNSSVVNVSYVVESGFDFKFQKTYNAVLSATGSVSTVLTKNLPFEDSNFCKYSNLGNLKTSIKDVQVIEGFGEDNDWFVFDKVEVEVLVENNGEEDVDNIVVEWGLYNTQSNEWTIEVDEETDFDLNDGDEETVTITFNINDKLDEDLEDLEEGTYIFYVRATGEIAKGVNEGEDTCSSDSENNNLMLERNFVILNNLEFPEVVQCDSEVEISADAWNIGSDDQNDVYVKVYNKELGINQDITVGDIDSFESSDFNFILQLPEDIQEKKYYLTLTVYDEDDDIYETGDDDQAVFSVLLDVQGSCAVAKASITAVLESGGEAGKLLVVKVTIVNTGKKTSTYSLNAAGYTEWASSATLDKTSLTLDAGKSAEVLLNFNVKKEALGINLFNFEIVSGNELVASQPVQVEITKKKWGITGNFLSGDNKYIWGIGILNLILIVLIIIIAVRIAKK